MGYWGLVLAAQMGWECVCSTSPSRRPPALRPPLEPHSQSDCGRSRLSWDTRWFWGSGQSDLQI